MQISRRNVASFRFATLTSMTPHQLKCQPCGENVCQLCGEYVHSATLPLYGSAGASPYQITARPVFATLRRGKPWGKGRSKNEEGRGTMYVKAYRGGPG